MINFWWGNVPTWWVFKILCGIVTLKIFRHMIQFDDFLEPPIFLAKKHPTTHKSNLSVGIFRDFPHQWDPDSGKRDPYKLPISLRILYGNGMGIVWVAYQYIHWIVSIFLATKRIWNFERINQVAKTNLEQIELRHWGLKLRTKKRGLEMLLGNSIRWVMDSTPRCAKWDWNIWLYTWMISIIYGTNDAKCVGKYSGPVGHKRL